MKKNTTTQRSLKTVSAIAVLSLAACGGNEAPVAEVAAPAVNPNIETAKQWVTAMSTGQAEGLAAVTSLMADDGQMMRSRYVGFGFTWDPSDGEGRMIVGCLLYTSPSPRD